MDAEYGSTPFGRRPIALGLLLKQARVVDPQLKRNKWKLFRAICEARVVLGLSDRSLSVLDALLSFYPADEICEDNGLVVFPSNAQLSIRARGMTAATLRRHLAALVEAGLIQRRDSPNGKRYARRTASGNIDEAYGFSLSPLLARAEEIEGVSARLQAERALLHTMKERLTICRRDIAKLIQAAMNDGVPGDWESLLSIYGLLVDRLPRTATLILLQPILDGLVELRAEILKQLESFTKAQNMDAIESQNERHIQDSKPQSLIESEARSETINSHPIRDEHFATEQSLPKTHLKGSDEDREMRYRTTPPLSLVTRACPEVTAYGPGGTIRTWVDLVTAASVLRSMLRISQPAFNHTCRVMGAENAATVLSCIYERGGAISSPGAYLSGLTRKAERGEFTPTPMLNALLRKQRLTI